MCVALPACVKQTTHTVLVHESDNPIDLCKKTLIDDCIDERFDFCSSSYSPQNQINPSLSPLSICQAKLFDIPIPMQAVFQADDLGDSADGLSINYSIILDQSAISCFYEREMERLGWQQLIENMSNNELLLVFNKPNKICVVSVRTPKDSRAGLLVVITTGTKKMGHSFE